jgi:hypothetical protein
MTRRCSIGSILLLCAAVSPLSTPAAPVVMYDLRVAGTGAKQAIISTPNQTVHLEVYAVVANQDGNHANDGMLSTSLRFLSQETPFSPLGNYQNAKKGPLFDGPFGDLGLPLNLDANPDLEWGNSSGTSITDNFNCFTVDLAPTFGNGSGSGPTEFFLGTIDWVSITPIFDKFQNTLLNVQYFKNSQSERGAYNFYSDGIFYASPAGDFNDADQYQSIGLPVVVTTAPEPATLFASGVVGVMLLARRGKSRR